MSGLLETDKSIIRRLNELYNRLGGGAYISAVGISAVSPLGRTFVPGSSNYFYLQGQNFGKTVQGMLIKAFFIEDETEVKEFIIGTPELLVKNQVLKVPYTVPATVLKGGYFIIKIKIGRREIISPICELSEGEGG